MTTPVPAREVPALCTRHTVVDTPQAWSTVVQALEGQGRLLDAFLAEPCPWLALVLWLGPVSLRGRALREFVVQRLTQDLAQIDVLLTRQVNKILHHPAFQRLEASWRGLRYLVEQIPDGENVKVRVLSVTWREVARDLERALEFDQSQLFRKVYSEEFGTPGGEPFGVLLGDYEIRPRPGPEHPYDDVALLPSLAGVAAAAFAPFIAAAHPSLLELTSFSDLELTRNLTQTYDQVEYVKWRAFRDTEDARFVGLVLPRVLARLPYRDAASRVDGFRFCEEVSEPSGHNYLWGTAVYAFGAVLIRCFAQSGWLANIRGVELGLETGGIVTGLPQTSFGTDRPGVAPGSATDAIISDAQEKELADLGFIPLCHCQDTGLAAFYSNQSVQQPKTYDEPAATVNARLSAMLQYLLCVSRFAHYLKVLARDKVGSFTSPGELEDYLRRWLSNYVTANDNAGAEIKARYPLREARVQVRERADKPGTYACVIHLRPHFQLDQMVSAVKLVTEMSQVGPR